MYDNSVPKHNSQHGGTFTYVFAEQAYLHVPSSLICEICEKTKKSYWYAD